MIATVCNNGQHHQSGAGYGIKINEQDRDRFFQRGWTDIILKLEGQSKEVEVNIDKPSFWGKTCRELISKEIGLWLFANNIGAWNKGNPPKLRLEPSGERRFNVSLTKHPATNEHPPN